MQTKKQNTLKSLALARRKRKTYTDLEKAEIRARVIKRFGPPLDGKILDMRAVMK